MTTHFLPEVATPFFSFLVYKRLHSLIHDHSLLYKAALCPVVEDGRRWRLVSCFPWCHPPLHLMRNGKWFVHSSCFNRLYQVDMKKDTKNRLCSLKNMEILQGGSYMETIVSPNQYMK